MTDEHTMAGLLRKRAEIAGKLEHAQTIVRQLVIDLDSLDTTIRLFSPDIDLEDVRPKALPPRHAAFKGQVSRILMMLLRDAKAPILTNELARHIMEERGLNTSDKRLVITIQKRVGSSLRNLRGDGIVRSHARPGKGTAWEIAR
jgi:hypothetical protein